MAKAKKEGEKTKTAQKKRYATHITTPNGKRVYLSAKSQEELDKKVAQAKMEMGAGVDIADDTTFAEYARLWIVTYKKPPKIRQNTYDTLNWHLEKNIIPFFGERALREIKPIHIQAFLASLSEYSYSVQAKCLQTVRAIFRSAEDNGLLLKSPVRATDKPGGVKTKEKEALTNEQAAQLLAAVKGTRAYLFCLLALSTGMRRSEILGLMWEDVDFNAGYITVRHSKALAPGRGNSKVSTMLKSESAYRRIPMPLLLRQTLELEHRVSASKFVLSMKDGDSLSKCSYDALWRSVTIRTAGEGKPLGSVHKSNNGEEYTVSLDFHCHPHLLRHTYITQLFESGLDIKEIQYLAGHSTPDMTLRVYTHYRQKSREQETAGKVARAVSYLGGSELKIVNGGTVSERPKLRVVEA